MGIRKDLFNEIDDKILNYLEQYEFYEDLSLLCGLSGINIYLAYKLSKSSYYDLLIDNIDYIFQEINNRKLNFGFCEGIEGIAWSIQYLVELEILDEGYSDSLSEIDKYSHKAALRDLNYGNGNYDFFYGAIGSGIYLLDRVDKNNNLSKLNDIFTRLKSRAIEDEEGIRWQEPKFYTIEENETVYNLSLSHGLASIIVFLSKLHFKNIEPVDTKHLIRGSVKYLLSNMFDNNNKSLFPGRIIEGKKPAPTRHAWSYGDLGIAIALIQAGEKCDEKQWYEMGFDIATHTLTRTDLEEYIVVDAELCRGSCGLAHMYKRIYEYTNQAQFKKLSDYWLDVTLKFFKNDKGKHFYKTWKGEDEGWVEELGILDGVSGIGLSLQYLLDDIDPKWDKALLLS